MIHCYSFSSFPSPSLSLIYTLFQSLSQSGYFSSLPSVPFHPLINISHFRLLMILPPLSNLLLPYPSSFIFFTPIFVSSSPPHPSPHRYLSLNLPFINTYVWIPTSFCLSLPRLPDHILSLTPCLHTSPYTTRINCIFFVSSLCLLFPGSGNGKGEGEGRERKGKYK